MSQHSEDELWPTPRASKIGGYSSPDFRPTLEQAVNQKLWPTPHGFSKDGKSNGPSGNELGHKVNHASTFSPVVSLANPSALRENAKALVTSVSSGTRCSGSYARYSPFGFWERTFGACSVLMEVEPSEPSCMNWPKWATAWDGECMELATLPLRIVVKGSSLWATPNAFDANDFLKGDLTDKTTKNGFQGGRKNLREEVVSRGMAGDMETGIPEDSPAPTGSLLWPTPRTGEKGNLCGGTGAWENLKAKEANGDIDHEEFLAMTSTGGNLSPDWVCWLQGFPDGWLDLPEHGTESQTCQESPEE